MERLEVLGNPLKTSKMMLISCLCSSLIYILVQGANLMGENKNSTIAGIGAILIAVGAALKAWFDGDATTVVDFATTIAAVVAGVGLILAKDASNKTPPVP